MGVKELREAFTLGTGGAATCTQALLEYAPRGGIEWQVMTFSGNYPDGSAFRIRSDQVRPGGDVVAVARQTGVQLATNPDFYKVVNK